MYDIITTDGAETLATAGSYRAALALARRILGVRRLTHDRSDSRHLLHASPDEGCDSVELIAYDD